ncbi:MAG TPA: hypothetical protein VLD37_03215 [Candidatus Bilamarchaeum sp.]|nr:hypothetical protein [Candidatus Bilamarchaeum sp.]
MHQETVSRLAERIKRDSGFADELASKVGSMGKADRETVIAAVVASGLCDSKIVRAIRSDFGSFQPAQEGLMSLSEFERDYASRKRD